MKEKLKKLLNILDFTVQQGSHIVKNLVMKIAKSTVKTQHYAGGNTDFVYFTDAIIVVIEEAHVFIPKQEYTHAKYFTTKVDRKGRKFGMGLIVAAQPPRSVDPNVLTQLDHQL